MASQVDETSRRWRRKRWSAGFDNPKPPDSVHLSRTVYEYYSALISFSRFWRPGAPTAYGNSGLALAAHIVENTIGQRFLDYVQQQADGCLNEPAFSMSNSFSLRHSSVWTALAASKTVDFPSKRTELASRTKSRAFAVITVIPRRAALIAISASFVSRPCGCVLRLASLHYVVHFKWGLNSGGAQGKTR
jgi:hypothetical protein